MIRKKTLPKESFRLAFKRTGALIVIAALLLAASLAGNFYVFARLNDGKAFLHSDLTPAPAVVPDDGAGPEQQQGTVLVQTQPVSREYFSDTLFIGDSITTGLNSVGGEVFGGDVAVAATLGLNTYTAVTDAFYKPPGSEAPMTAVDAVVFHRPRKVYIMLGANGIEYGGIDWNIEGFNGLITEIRARLPGVFIVIQSMLPVTAKFAASRKMFSRANVDEYNAKLLDLCLQKGVYYLDVCSPMSDENGNLRSDVDGGDGMHLGRKGYEVWYECIVTHAVLGASSYILDEDGRFVYRPSGQTEGAETEAEN